MPGPITINNAQDAFNMLGELQNNKTGYMVASDGKTLKSASLGHRIRQFLGWDSAKQENQAVLDLIKNTLKDDPRYATLAENMFNNVNTGTAITADTIKNAFGDFKREMMLQTKAAVQHHINTTLTNKLLDLGNKELLHVFNAFNLTYQKHDKAVTKLKDYLSGRCLQSINTAPENSVTKATLNERIEFYLSQLHDDFCKTDPKTNTMIITSDRDMNAIRNIVTAMTNVLSNAGQDIRRGDLENISTLHATNSQIDIEKINVDDKDGSFAQLNTNLANLQQNVTDKLLVDSDKKKINGMINTIQNRLNTLSTSKSIVDERAFEVRLAKDKELQKAFSDLKQHILDAMKSITKAMNDSLAAQNNLTNGDTETHNAIEALELYCHDKKQLHTTGDLTEIKGKFKNADANIIVDEPFSINPKGSESPSYYIKNALKSHMDFLDSVMPVMQKYAAIITAANA